MRERRAQRNERVARLAAAKADESTRAARAAKRQDRKEVAKSDAIHDAVSDTRSRLETRRRLVKAEIGLVGDRSLLSIGSVTWLTSVLVAISAVVALVMFLAPHSAPPKVWLAFLWLPIVIATVFGYAWYEDCYQPWRSKFADIAKLQKSAASISGRIDALDAGDYDVEYDARTRFCEVHFAD